MTILTLTTDFGQREGFVGTMKGVIWSIAPEVKIADISHDISPQNILEGAFALWRAAPFFPRGTVHVAVIDPGVGTSRRPIAVNIDGQFLVGPDNGVFTPFLEHAEKHSLAFDMICLDNPRYWLPKVSHTFHGRDIFSPAGAYLAIGTNLQDMGTPIEDPIRVDLPKPQKTVSGWITHITVIDVFGNLTTDLHADHLKGSQDIRCRLGGHEIIGLVSSYGERKPGELVALIDSEDYLEIAQVQGSAARMLDARVGDVVEVMIKPHEQ